jgi:acetyl esterase/lipase
VELEARLDRDHRAVYRAMPSDLMGLEDIPATRQRVRQLREKMRAVPAPPEVECTQLELPASPPVAARHYRRRDLGPTPSAALLWIHGGGMVMGDLDMDDAWCRRVADQLGIHVIATDYRLAPEYPYPAPIEDCYVALSWVFENALDLGIDPTRIAVGGASAGGGLAAGLCLLARDRGDHAPAFQFLMYPMLEDREIDESSPSASDPKVWNATANRRGWECYLAAVADDVPIYAAPARATDLSGLPPTYICVGELDLFLKENMAYASSLTRSGIPTELRMYPGAFHASNTFVSESALSRRWLVDDLNAIARGLSLAD